MRATDTQVCMSFNVDIYGEPDKIALIYFFELNLLFLSKYHRESVVSDKIHQIW